MQPISFTEEEFAFLQSVVEQSQFNYGTVIPNIDTVNVQSEVDAYDSALAALRVSDPVNFTDQQNSFLQQILLDYDLQFGRFNTGGTLNDEEKAVLASCLAKLRGAYR